MITPILATDYTGAIEGLIWFGVNALVALAVLIVWLMLIFQKTRASAIEQLGTLVRCGWVLLLMVGLQIHPNLVVRNPRDWDSFYWMSGISLALFLGVWVTHRIFKPR
jgi:hypothetical protein